MTKEQFDAGIGEFYDKEAITKVYALIGPREDCIVLKLVDSEKVNKYG